MPLILSISSSTVSSESHRLHELFNWGAHCIEIGDLKSYYDFYFLSEQCERLGFQMAIHSPLFTIDDRFGLLWDSDVAWEELARNLDIARNLNVPYVLVHFPYLWNKAGRNLGINRVRETVPKLKDLEQRFGIRVVCEPKVGPRRDPSAFTVLCTVTQEELSQWDLSLCLDVGDIYLACRSLKYNFESMVSHLSPWCRVVHLHHVWHGGTRHSWSPVSSYGNVPILTALQLLRPHERDIYAVIQHVPYRVTSGNVVAEGIQWLVSNAGPWKDPGYRRR